MTPSRVLYFGLLMTALASTRGAGAEPRRVLLLHSFGRDFAPFNTASSTLRTELVRQAPGPVDLYEASLDAARFSGTVLEGPFMEYLHALFAGRQPDLVIPIGGPAAQFAQRHRQHLFPGAPMVIAATEERHLVPMALTTNDAVVALRIELGRVMDTILELLPQTTNVAVVIGSSPVEQFWRQEVGREFAPFTNRLALEWLHDLTFEQMQARCAALPPHSVIFYTLLSLDGAGVPHREERALAGLHAVARAPIFGLHQTQLGHGIVGGLLVDVEELGRSAARVAARILRGESPATLAVPPQRAGPPRFDWRELRRWRIDAARLPAGSAVLFREPAVWEVYRGRILAATAFVLAQACLIAFLVASLLKRRRAERSLREREEQLTLAAAAGNIGIWIWDVAGGRVWGTDNWTRMFGFPPDAPIGYADVIARIHPDDREEVDRRVQRALRDQSAFHTEYRVTLPDGAERWIAAQGRLQPDATAKAPRMLGAAVDISEQRRAEKAARNLSGRLIATQEAERARLARELHDDITQRLARLAIDVGRCEHGLADRSPAETVRAVREGLVRLSDDVHALSYRLHPSVLEDLGLAEALKAEGERFRRQESLPLELTFSDLPEAVPGDVALCLFRVAQEALRNVARHARARTVTLLLRGFDGGLQLAVRDDGRGFDPAAARDHPSLGLASMRERVHLVEGDLDVESAPGQGTAVVASVPLTGGPR